MHNFNLSTRESGQAESKDRLVNTASSRQARAIQTLCEHNTKYKNGIKTKSVGHSRGALCLGQRSTRQSLEGGH